jgi:hypothetical protein
MSPYTSLILSWKYQEYNQHFRYTRIQVLPNHFELQRSKALLPMVFSFDSLQLILIVLCICLVVLQYVWDWAWGEITKIVQHCLKSYVGFLGLQHASHLSLPGHLVKICLFKRLKIPLLNSEVILAQRI